MPVCVCVPECGTDSHTVHYERHLAEAPPPAAYYLILSIPSPFPAHTDRHSNKFKSYISLTVRLVTILC
jgi:hypothetical protein